MSAENVTINWKPVLIKLAAIGLKAVWNINGTCPRHFVSESECILYIASLSVYVLTIPTVARTKYYIEGPLAT